MYVQLNEFLSKKFGTLSTGCTLNINFALVILVILMP